MYIVIHVGGLLDKGVTDEQYEDFIVVLLEELISQHFAKRGALARLTVYSNGDKKHIEVDENASFVFDYVLTYPETLVGSPFLSISNLAGSIKGELIDIIKNIIGRKEEVNLNDLDDFYILIDVELIDRKYCIIEFELIRK